MLVGEEMWPSQDFSSSEDKDLEENVVDTSRESSISIDGVENVGVGEVIDIGRFSSSEALLGVTGYVMRSVRNLEKISNKGEGMKRWIVVRGSWKCQIIIGIVPSLLQSRFWKGRIRFCRTLIL